MERAIHTQAQDPGRWHEIFKIISAEWGHSQKEGFLDAAIARTDYKFDTPKQMKQALVDQESRSRDTLDFACAQFARDRHFPGLDAEQALILVHRMKQALDFLEMARLFPRALREPSPEVPDSYLIEFLLVHYWTKVGRDRWLAQQTLHLR